MSLKTRAYLYRLVVAAAILAAGLGLITDGTAQQVLLFLGVAFGGGGGVLAAANTTTAPVDGSKVLLTPATVDGKPAGKGIELPVSPAQLTGLASSFENMTPEEATRFVELIRRAGNTPPAN